MEREQSACETPDKVSEAHQEDSEAGLTSSLIKELEHALHRMDALGLGLAAAHVSQGLELVREHANSLDNGGNL